MLARPRGAAVSGVPAREDSSEPVGARGLPCAAEPGRVRPAASKIPNFQDFFCREMPNSKQAWADVRTRLVVKAVNFPRYTGAPPHASPYGQEGQRSRLAGGGGGDAGGGRSSGAGRGTAAGPSVSGCVGRGVPLCQGCPPTHETYVCRHDTTLHIYMQHSVAFLPSVLYGATLAQYGWRMPRVASRV